MQSNTVPRTPKCPVCDAAVAYLRINVVNPFPCPSCGHQLRVPETYRKRVRVFPVVFGIATAIAATVKYWDRAPRTDSGVMHAVFIFFITYSLAGFAASLFGVIFVKRIFPPTLEDYEEYCKQPHYPAL